MLKQSVRSSVGCLSWCKVFFITSHFPKAKTIYENENGGHLKIDDLTFEHIHESNTKIMTSLKTQIHFYYLSMPINVIILYL
jgi:hypothetical protein